MFLTKSLYPFFSRIFFFRKKNIPHLMSRNHRNRNRKREKHLSPTWRIIPVSKWLVTPIYKPFKSFIRGIIPFRGLTITMVINHLLNLNGMILQAAVRHPRNVCNDGHPQKAIDQAQEIQTNLAMDVDDGSGVWDSRQYSTKKRYNMYIYICNYSHIYICI